MRKIAAERETGRLGTPLSAGNVSRCCAKPYRAAETALRARDARTLSTVRLIMAGAQGSRHRRARQGNAEGISEAEIQRMLQAMVKQRRELIALYEQGNRPDLAQQEREEIVVIESLPRRARAGEIEAVRSRSSRASCRSRWTMTGIEAAAKAAIAESGAAGPRTWVAADGRTARTPCRGHRPARAGAIVRRLLGQVPRIGSGSAFGRAAAGRWERNRWPFRPAFSTNCAPRISLADLVGRRVRSSAAAANMRGLCPFHNEKTPSFYVVEDKGFFHCFGCGAHGDAIGFVMRAENLDFIEAIERLAGRPGSRCRSRPRRSASGRSGRKRLLEAFGPRRPFYEAQLWVARRRARPRISRPSAGSTTRRSAASVSAGPAMTARRCGARLARRFSGAAAGRCRAAAQFAPTTASRTIISASRVMFPIGDRAGRVIAFGGRALGDGQPKYLNSPDIRCSRRAGCSTAGRRRGHMRARSERPRDAGASSPKATWT